MDEFNQKVKKISDEVALYLSLKKACNREIIKAKDKEIAQLTSELTADNKILRTAIEYYKDDAVVREAQIERLETEVKEKDAIIFGAVHFGTGIRSGGGNDSLDGTGICQIPSKKGGRCLQSPSSRLIPCPRQTA